MAATRKKRVGWGATVIALAAIATGLTVGGTSMAASSKGGQDSLPALKRQIQSLSKRPTKIGVTAKLKSLPKGKLFIHMRCAAPICVAASKEYRNAAHALGMRFKAIDAGSTPSSIAQAFDKAVADKPAALISGAIAPQLFQKQLKELVKNGTKVILYATAPPNPKGVTAIVFPPKVFTLIGTLLARFVYADAGGKPMKAVYIQTPELPALNYASDAFKKELKRLCPSCDMSVLPVTLSEIGTGIPAKVVSYLQAHPDTQYVITQFGDLEVGVPQALKAAGITGKKLVSTQGSNVNMQYVKAGQEYADLISFLNVTYWQVLDIAARALAGQEFTVPPVPEQWIQKSNLNFPPNSPPPFGRNYKAEFKKLWGVK